MVENFYSYEKSKIISLKKRHANVFCRYIYKAWTKEKKTPLGGDFKIEVVLAPIHKYRNKIRNAPHLHEEKTTIFEAIKLIQILVHEFHKT
jgi:hypothetical protein